MSAAFRYHAPILTQGIDNLVALYDAGATLACGNDGGIPPLTPAMVGYELEHLRLVLGGASGGRPFGGAESVRCATCNSARAVGASSHRGVLAPGAVADFVMYNVNPLEHPEVIGEVAQGVVAGGVPVHGLTK